MNKKVFVLVFVSLLLIGVVVFLVWGSLSSWLYPENFRYEEDGMFWVEVVTPEVVASYAGSSTPRILRTGDEVGKAPLLKLKRGVPQIFIFQMDLLPVLIQRRALLFVQLFLKRTRMFFQSA